MKFTFRFLIVLFSIILADFIIASGNNFSFTPQKPKPGEAIVINYNPAGTELENSTAIKMVAYFYGKDLKTAEEYDLSKKQNSWTGKITTSDSTCGVVVLFYSGEEKDNNQKNGYIINFFDKTGKTVPGSKAGLASGYYDWFYYLGIEADPQKAHDLFQEEFSNYPESKKEYLQYYLFSINQTQQGNAKDTIINELKKIESLPHLDENNLETLVYWYDRLKVEGKSQPFKDKLLQLYPNSQYAQSQKFIEYKSRQDADEKIKSFNEFLGKFGSNRYSDYMQGDIIRTILGNGDFIKVKDFVEGLKDPRVSSLNNVSWGIFSQSGDLNAAEMFAKKGVELAQKELDNPNEKKPVAQTQKEWDDTRKSSLGTILDTYGAILIKQGKKDEALNALSKSVELTNRTQNIINQRYAELLVDLGQHEKAQKEIEIYIVSGKSKPEMKDLLKQAFEKSKGTVDGFEKYYSEIDLKAKENAIKKLKKEMIDEPAPQFTLSDLNGNQVSVSDFKGKIVIVDFWATWCGPCLSSFPGMKQALEKFGSDGSVEFLFVNAWENVDNKKQNAAEFIQKNNYPFHVLVDENNEAISNFKVSGIPTKFFIDKNGNIRYKSIGFENTEEMLNEIELIISLLK
jgi:peroxiredoxin